VSSEVQTGQPQLVWAVLRAERNPKYSHNAFIEALSGIDNLHVFASTTAHQFFLDEWRLTNSALKTALAGKKMIACGVGSTTDQAARSLADASIGINWSVPELADNGIRRNGLDWTLNRLEELGLIPDMSLQLWTKIDSTSEKILQETKLARNWDSWKVRTHEIYVLEHVHADVPALVKTAINDGSPICFGAKSAEVLDATVRALMLHCNVTDPKNFAQCVHFSVWEKGAQQKAQQLLLQQRLIPWSEFEKLLRRNSP
jgi:hypothetical protein